MKANLHLADRIVRIVLAFTLIILYLQSLVSGAVGIIMLAVATLLLITAWINFCPLYHLLGISTKKKTNHL